MLSSTAMQAATLTEAEHRKTANTPAGKCRICKKACRVGEVVATIHLDAKAYGDPRVRFHVTCMAVVVDNAPSPDTYPRDPDAARLAIKAELEAAKAALAV